MIRCRLDDGEALPGRAVGVDGGVHPVRGLDGLEPEPVVREPVLRVVDDDADELVLVEGVQERGRVVGAWMPSHRFPRVR